MREYKLRDGAIIEYRDGVEFREVSQDHQGYVAWLEAGNSPGELPPSLGPSLDAVKSSAHAQIKAATQAYIVKAYPEWKQCNIIRQGAGYTQADLDTMAQYIDEARFRSTQAELALDAPGIDSPQKVAEFMAQLATQYAGDVGVQP